MLRTIASHRHAVYDSTQQLNVYKPLKVRLHPIVNTNPHGTGALMRTMNVVSSATSQNNSRRWER